MQKLANRTAVVTGAARGIGRAIALEYAREGAAVAIVDLDAAGAATTAEEVRRAGGTALAVELDVADDEVTIEAALGTIVSHLGPIRILVNNAAVFDPEIFAGDRDFASTTKEVWMRTLAVNVVGPALVSKYAVRSMIEAQQGGCIINLASTGAFVGDVGSVAYRTSKAALVNLTRCMAASHAAHGIRCNAIAPGLIMSPVALEHSSAERLAMFERGRLIKEVGTPEDVASLALFLASDESRYITGHTHLIDGGASILQSWHALSEVIDEERTDQAFVDTAIANP